MSAVLKFPVKGKRKARPARRHQTRQQPHAQTVLKELGLKYECSEVGNMDRFADQHTGKLIYIPQKRSWYLWDSLRYRRAGDEEVHELALETAKSIFDEARDCQTEQGCKQVSSWAYSSRSETRIKRMISMAAKSPKLVRNIADFDQDGHLVNCQNGIVDLKTGELLERTPDSLVTKLAPVAYDRKSNCPTFDRLLWDVFSGDGELLRWLQRAVGYTLTGSVDEHVFFLAYGTGANGKSTLFETLLDILGDYGRAAEFETFLATDKGNVRVLEGIAKLQGVRFALASETDSTRRFSESVVKKITGGDTVTGTQLYGKSFEFRPQFKLWLLANHLPIAKDASHGFWRRVKVIPFNRTFEAHQIDQGLREKLLAEKEGIFAWCVRGAKDWYQAQSEKGGRSGLGSCKAIEEAVDLYKEANDSFSPFIEECLTKTTEAQTPASELYEAYKRWCAQNDDTSPVSQHIFSSRMVERGFAKRRTRKGMVYGNVELNQGSPCGAYEF